MPLYVAWARALLASVADDIIQQLVLPSVTDALADWRPRTGAPLLGARSCDFRTSDTLLDAHHKVRSVLCV
jgi:hypothetical protein